MRAFVCSPDFENGHLELGPKIRDSAWLFSSSVPPTTGPSLLLPNIPTLLIRNKNIIEFHNQVFSVNKSISLSDEERRTALVH